MSDRVTSPLPGALADRVVAADGARGTAFRSVDIASDDSAGHLRYDEIRDLTGTHVVRHARRGCPAAGADAVGSTTSGAHLAGHGVEDGIVRPSRRGAEPARATVAGYFTA